MTFLSGVFFVFICMVVCDSWMSTTVCYNEIGCFGNKSPFNNALLFLPQSPTQVGVTYQLFTRENSNLPQILTTDKNVISSSNFNGGKGTKFIIHGYRSSASASFVIDIKDAILKREDANVIAVDWKKGADQIIYAQAVANTRVVGALISLLMKTLDTVARGNSFARMHLIGHSLGAQVAGYAGERTLGTGRITGLDPAGPLFTQTDPKVRLDPSDASFVDVIHTNANVSGIGHSVGHVDFYPNGGERQPGCLDAFITTLITAEFEKIEEAFFCSHMRAVYYFTESINSICHFQSYPCKSCTTCGTGCAKMGYDAPEGNPRGNYFLSTNSKPPFCIA
ncbi:hypothetical protein CHS0354_023577 [Potamilus streckersoni]|uniref:Lipase domain-containing protein n=1 Tax=Potamilus streckersoni TaxID=2493646 RepID=A0AAE0SYW9_9BIVA|nr:hypothetical protein CHS0354_023577 [Potamilus streckersoni]